ncbi:hypothetical protein [Polaribacter glomeratus]|uniref:Import component protein n=1 Tax=Polaribacter glomeratus TaxID=102 RepID=A0A2S7WY09_9FLAO|nr:hypothetical protein [Polaribacter glomeratus]PQJ82222.1 hypothetical protein BTO16_06375 [Polaribacter glomeratus]TXD66817.1 hypothetical protein ESX12_04685 [Polaribacter glomeratus]
MENYTVKEGKTAAIISYITVFGTIIAFFMNNSKKNSFTSFHIRQMIGIFLLTMINKYIVYDFLGTTASYVAFILIAILWVIGFIGAVKGEEKLVPYVGQQFQNWFKNF